MKIKIRFQDGMTGGILTTEHSQSSYSVPVFVPDEYTRDYMDHDYYGPADLKQYTPFVPEGVVNEETLEMIRSAGYRIEI